MKDVFQQVRSQKGYARRDVSNRQARAKIKNRLRKEMKKED